MVVGYSGMCVFYFIITETYLSIKQKALHNANKKGATIIPIIISTDKTQLTLFRGKLAYPVYITIGNLPKDIRRKPSMQGQILLAYLPVTKLKHVKNNKARRRLQANLFHAGLRFLLQPTAEPAVDGVSMRCGDGHVRRCHPIFAIHVGDYPEQCEVTCVKSRQCPTCDVDVDQLGDWHPEWLANPSLYNLEDVLDAIDSFGHKDWKKFCEAAGIRPVYRPYWAKLPYADPFLSICPDILHQIYQGLIKHLLEWLKEIYGSKEIDRRCAQLPPNHHIRVFTNGICSLSRVSGQEHADITRIILGIIIDLPLKKATGSSIEATAKVISTVRALLDFAYLAQYPVHSSETLTQMNEALERFHTHKDIFITLGARSDFDLNKLHYALHYRIMIERFGTTDNYNTEYTERLHIPYAKDAYEATNRKNEFSQMTVWVERKEKILKHEKYIAWCLSDEHSISNSDSVQPQAEASQMPTLKMTKHPSKKAVTFDVLKEEYHATMFDQALVHYILKQQNPDFSYSRIENMIPYFSLPFDGVSVYHKARFWLGSQENYRLQSNEYNVIHARPLRLETKNKEIPARFDTVLVDSGRGGYVGVKEHRVARVKVIFALTKSVVQRTFAPNVRIPKYLAYVEWYSSFKESPEDDHLLYEVRKVTFENKPVASIIPLYNIVRSVHLFPKLPISLPEKWTSSTILDDCDIFYVNSFSDRHAFHTIV